MAQYFLGVDGGGTKCRMQLVDAGQKVLGEASTKKPSNLQVRGGDAAYEAINELTKKIFLEAGLDITSDGAKTFACFGMAGARMASAREAFAARQFPFAKLHVCDDIDIARAGAHDGGEGAVLIIGTGSAGLGIMNGQRHQVGGWGFYAGDDMSGAILGRRLLRLSILAHEGLITPSELTRAFMARFDNDPGKIMEWSFCNPEIGRPPRPSDYGEFVPLIMEYYEKSDPLASDLIEYELAAIKTYIDWFCQRGAKAIAVAGGLGERLSPILNKRFGSVIVQPRSTPLEGATIMARQVLLTA